MEKLIVVTCLALMAVTIILGVKSLRDLNDGRVKTAVFQLVK